MLNIIPILLFTILCICLPKLLALSLLGIFGYFILKILNRRNAAKMVLILTVFSCLSVIMEKVMPIVKDIQQQTEKVKPYEQIIKSKKQDKKYIDKKIDEYTGDNWFIKILTDYPNDKE